MKNLFRLILFTFLFSCHRDTSETAHHGNSMVSSEPAAVIASEAMAPTKESHNMPLPNQDWMVQEGHLILEVENFKEVSNRLPSFLSTYEAHISEENQSSDLYSIRTQYTIRVPAARFDTLVRSLQALSIHTEQKNISSHDVSEEYIDIEARLRTKKIYEEKYFQLLNKAKNLEELIEIQNQLRAIREEIESMEGRKKYLESRVSMSTIHLTLFEKTDYQYTEKENGIFYRLKKSFMSGWDTSLNIAFGLLSIWPITIFFTIFVILIRKYYQKKKPS